MLVLTASQSREADRLAIASGIPAATLMENAGRGAFEILKREFPDLGRKAVLVVCGKGNNGDDGRIVARLLEGNAQKVQVVNIPLNPPLEKGGWGDFDIVVDALFGTGLSRPVEGAAKEAITAINRAPWILSLDAPSGLDGDTGEPLGIAVKANVTVTMGRPKVGLIQPKAVPYVGRLEVVPIGIPEEIYGTQKSDLHWVTAETVRPWFAPRAADTHKGSYGHVLTVGGSESKPGSILLSGRAALRTGSGLATVALPDKAFRKSPVRPPLKKGGRGDFLELMYAPLPSTRSGTLARKAWLKISRLLEDKAVVALGPGLGVNADTKSLVRDAVLKAKLPLVLDADALNALNPADLKKRRSPTVLTPHPGEMARLTGLTTAKVQKNRIELTRDFAVAHRVIVVLKGARTVTATPEGQAFVNATGNPGMATAGMGDVLTGVIASLIGQGWAPEQAAVAGVWLHGRAGDRVASRLGDRGLLAGDVSDELPPAMQELIRNIRI